MGQMHRSATELRKNYEDQTALLESVQNDVIRMQSELAEKDESIEKLGKARDKQSKEAAKSSRHVIKYSIYIQV